MTKQSGLGDNLYVGGYDLSGDTGEIEEVSSPIGTFDVTGIDKYAFERLLGQRDGKLTFNAFFNPTGAHPVLAALPRTDVGVAYLRGTGLGSAAACMLAKQIGYDGKRDQAGAYTLKVESLANATGLEWGTQLTPGKRSDTTATNGTGVDGGATSAFGLQAYLHVFSFTGTSVTAKLQESSDNGAGDAWTDVVDGAFVAATAVGHQRIRTSATLAVERYLRVVTTGTFTQATFAVIVNRNETAVVF